MSSHTEIRCWQSKPQLYQMCPFCGVKNRTTTTKTEISFKTHVAAILLCLAFVPCACIPYFCDSCKTTNHYCAQCKQFLGSTK